MDIPIIRIDSVVEYYMLNEKCEWDERDFPNVAPPFEHFKLEYTIPNYIFVAGKMNKHPLAHTKWSAEYKVSCHEENTYHNKMLISEEGWVFDIEIKSNTDLYCDVLAFCNKYGVLTSMFMINDKLKAIVLLLPAEHYQQRKQMSDFFTTMLQPQLLALSFLHCKNVTREEVDPNKDVPRHILKHWQKKGKPLLDKYYVLNIEPMKAILKSEGKSDTVGISKALHICRGHFKDYSKGKGLFGKYHGLFWWDNAVKGSKEKGEVNKEYNIKI